MLADWQIYAGPPALAIPATTFYIEKEHDLISCAAVLKMILRRRSLTATVNIDGVNGWGSNSRIIRCESPGLCMRGWSSMARFINVS